MIAQGHTFLRHFAVVITGSPLGRLLAARDVDVHAQDAYHDALLRVGAGRCCLETWAIGNSDVPCLWIKMRQTG